MEGRIVKAQLLKILQFLGSALAVIIIFVAVVLYAIRFTTPYLQHHHAFIEHWLSSVMDQPVRIGGIAINRTGIDPVVQLRNVVVLNDEATRDILEINSFDVGVSVVRSILRWRIEPSFMVVSGANIDVVQGKDFTFHDLGSSSERVQHIMEWLFTQSDIYLKKIAITWHGRDGVAINFPSLSLRMRNVLSEHQVVGFGSVSQGGLAWFHFVINIHGDVLHYDHLLSDGYLSVKDLALRNWLTEMPIPGLQLQKGNVDAKIWFSADNSQIKRVQSDFTLRDVLAKSKADSRAIDIKKLSGNVVLSQNRANWQLAGDYTDGQINLFHLFKQPLNIDALKGVLIWTSDASGLRMRAQKISALNDDAQLNANADIFFPNSKSKPVVDLNANYTLNNVANISRYYPVKLMSKGLVGWLEQSIKSGDSASGKIVWNNGKFQSRNLVHNITLDYAKKWPEIDHINAQLNFVDKGMQVIGSGAIYNSSLSNVHVSVDDMMHPLLKVDGDAAGDSTAFMQFIQNSPLQKSLGPDLNNLTFSGLAALHLNFSLPLASTPGEPKVSGSFKQKDGVITIPGWKLSLQHVNGSINFTEDSISASSITADLFGQSLKLSISTAYNKFHHSEFRVIGDGALAVKNLQAKYQNFILAHLQGTTNYHLLLKLHRHDDSLPDVLQVSSNMSGIAVNLPVPFAKAPLETKKLIAKVDFAKSSGLVTTVKYADTLSAKLNYSRNKDKLVFVNGAIALGRMEPPTPLASGLVLVGEIPDLVWSDWQPYLSFPHQPGEQPLLRKIDLNIANLSALGQVFTDTNITAASSASGWLANVNNDKINCAVTVPVKYPQQQVLLHFNKLTLLSLDSSVSQFSPTDIPPMRIEANNVRYNDTFIKSAVISMWPQQSGVKVDVLQIKNDDFAIDAAGKWIETSGSQASELQGKLTTNDLGALLRNKKITQNLQGGSGALSFALRWPAALYKPSLPILDGKLSLHFIDGTIVNLSDKTEEKIGFGRVLSLFSLQSLPRRLTLNFSDLTQKGFAFDLMKGDFKLLGGNAFTDNASLEGVVAHIDAKGRVGLVSKDYDIIFTLIPHVTSSLPLLVTLAGGPVAGAVTWAADELFKHTLQKATAYKYRVTGPWAHPNVEKLNG